MDLREEMTRVLREWGCEAAMVDALVWAYEANVTTTRLEALLRQRGPGSIIPTPPLPLEVRAELQPCADPACGRLIAPGQAYVVDGPFHVGCGRDER